MLYLNDDFEGGCTNFFGEEQRHYVRPKEENVIKKVKGRAGMALVFNSQLLHDGGVLEGGEKYIMRSEVMYRKLKDK